jgi:hypothetical protein
VIEYSEDVLNMFALCPLRTEAPVSTGHFPVATEVLQWALLREFERDRPPLMAMRERYCVVWKSLYYPDYKNSKVPPDHPTYWEGPRKAASIGKRIHDFVSKFEVIHPLQPYALTFGAQRVRGSYALVRRRTEGGIPMVLVFHPHAPLHKTYPDMRSLARWVAARRERLERNLGVYNLPLLRGEPWQYKDVNERLANRWLQSILESIPKSNYANPGPHCSGCARHDCLEVLRDR